jgi:hypothetical protein
MRILDFSLKLESDGQVARIEGQNRDPTQVSPAHASRAPVKTKTVRIHSTTSARRLLITTVTEKRDESLHA